MVTNNVGDHVTRVYLSVLMVALIAAVVILGVWIRDTRKTVSQLSQGLMVVASEMKIQPSEVLPSVHY